MTAAVAEQAVTEAALALGQQPDAAPDIESDTPNVEPQAWLNMKKRSRKTRDLMKGVEAIRAGGTFYLPMYRSESLDRYEARRTIAGLFNAFKSTVKAAVGMILQTPPVLDEKMPAKLVAMAENVDGLGTHLDVFTNKLVTAAVVDGLAGIITEYPRADDPTLDRSKASLAAQQALATGDALDAADEEAIGLRPYFILVKSDNVLFPVYEMVNGKRTLVMIVFVFSSTKRTGRFSQKTAKTWRVYSLENGVVMYELWTETDGGARQEGATVAMRNVKRIPWSPLPAGEEIAPNEWMPGLYDLAEMNVTLHRLQSGELSLIERGYVSTLVRVGAEPDSEGRYPDITIGPESTIEVPLPSNGGPTVPNPLYYISPPTDVLEPGFRAIENCKTDMGAMALSVIAPDPIVEETATANRRDDAAQKANVSSVARATQDCLESAFTDAAQFIGEPPGGVAINRDFEEAALDAQLMQAYTALANAGFPKKWIVIALQNGGRISPDADPDDVVAEWDAKSATLDAEKQIAAKLALSGELPDETPNAKPKKKAPAPRRREKKTEPAGPGA